MNALQPMLEFPAFYCDKCGEVSENRFLHDLNHLVAPGSDLCVTQSLREQHQRGERK